MPTEKEEIIINIFALCIIKSCASIWSIASVVGLGRQMLPVSILFYRSSLDLRFAVAGLDRPIDRKAAIARARSFLLSAFRILWLKPLWEEVSGREGKRGGRSGGNSKKD